MMLVAALAAAFATVGAVDLITVFDDVERAVVRGRLAEARGLVVNALVQTPDDIELLGLAAELALRQGDYDEARRVLVRLLELDPNDDSARLLLARAQWHAGDATSAALTVEGVLQRHPQLVEALELRASLARGVPPAARPSPWRPVARLAVAGGYDSNFTLDDEAVASDTGTDAGVLVVDAAAGVTWRADASAWTLMARLATTQPLTGTNDDPSGLAGVAPTTLGLVTQGKLPAGPFDGSAELRVLELYSGGLARHRQRLVAPSMAMSLPWSRGHATRLLVGAELRMAGADEPDTESRAFRASLRDALTLRRWILTVDAGVRSSAAEGARVPLADFLEVGLTAGATWRWSESLALAGLAEALRRDFDNFDPETTLHGQLGITQALAERVELHAEYDLTKNDGADERSFVRHQLLFGLRLWLD